MTVPVRALSTTGSDLTKYWRYDVSVEDHHVKLPKAQLFLFTTAIRQKEMISLPTASVHARLC